MKPYLTILAGLLLSYAPYAKAQNHPQLINSREIITEGIDYYQNEKYDSAMHFFNLISRYDTNYAWATYEKALTLASLEKHHEAIEMAKFGLTLEPMELLNYNIIGSSYDALEEYQKAYDTYNEALKKFPYNHDLLFNKAVCYQLWDEKKKSIEQHFENLDIIPYSGSTHLRLALLAEKEGLATQAMLSFALFLVIEPDGGRSFSILNEMNKLGQLSSEIYKSEQDSKIPSEFEKQDLIFDNKIPLNDKYKVPSKYNFAFIKQLYAIFDFIKKDKNLKDGLWTDFYTPIFKDIANTVDFENFSLLLLASATEETIAKEVQKHLSKIIDTRNQILDIVYKHNNTIELTIDGKSKEFSKYFTTQRRLDAIGNKSKDDLKEGKWLVYSAEGYLQAEAYFEKGKQVGTWYYFNKNGDTTSIVNYAKDELNGLYTKFYDNGLLKEKLTYVNGKREGEWTYYYPSGNLKIKEFFKNDKASGAGERYFTNGNIEYKYNYNEGKLDGKLQEFYANGNVYESTSFVNDEKNGPYQSFFRNNTTQATYKHLKGLSDGVYKKYHVNGKLYSEGRLEKNKAVGEWKYYSFEGKLEQIAQLDESGKINGKSKSFDYNGKLYLEANYVKGELKSQTIYDTLGQVIEETKIPVSGAVVNLYNHRREVVSVGKLDRQGKQGLWKFYNNAGIVKEETNYKDDSPNGKSITYHPNGNVKQILFYKNGSIDSLYLEYYPNNILKEEGNYVDGKRWQEWNEYYVNGQTYCKRWYENNLIIGARTYFDSYGKKISEEYYNKDGVFNKLLKYDSLENVFDSLHLVNGNGLYTSKHINGQIATTVNYFGGLSTGKRTSYYPNEQVYCEGEMLNGRQNGKWTYYHPNGQIKSTGEYLQGDYMGYWIKYNLFGELDDEDTYLFGDENGLSFNYYPNGKKRSEREYLNGESHGKFTFYEPNGELMIVRYYEHGKLIGYSYNNTSGTLLPMIPIENETVDIKSYYSNGKLATEYRIVKGAFQGELKHYYPNGDILHSAIYKDDYADGINQYFYPGNKTMKKIDYDLDRAHGNYVEHYENGQLKVSGKYHYGNREGVFSYFDEAGNTIAKHHYRNNDIIAVLK